MDFGVSDKTRTETTQVFIVGQYFRRFAGSAQYGPTFARGGNAALFAIEVFAVDASTTLTATIEHKNIECGV